MGKFLFFLFLRYFLTFFLNYLAIPIICFIFANVHCDAHLNIFAQSLLELGLRNLMGTKLGLE